MLTWREAGSTKASGREMFRIIRRSSGRGEGTWMKDVDVAVLQMSTSMELTYLQQVRTHGMRSGAETSMSESRSSEWTQTSRFV